MRILSIDTNKAEVDFYLRCMEDGHKVKCYIKQDASSKNIGRGLLDIVHDWREHIEWADIIYLADNTKWLAQLDALRKTGKLVIGATEASAKWELDRETGQNIFDKCDIETIASEAFDNYDEAIKYVTKTGGRLVSKPCGDTDKSLSYVSKSPEDMVFMLQKWKKTEGKCDIIIQKFIPGIEMAVGGWIGPKGFNAGWCENFEFKKLMNDDIGVNTGEMGTVLMYVKQSKLANEVLKPIEKELLKTGHTGYVDVAVIIDEHGQPWPLEFTMRPGYPTFNIQQPLHSGDCADWLLDLAEGEDADNLIYNTPCVGVVVAIPDFPYCERDVKLSVGTPIYGAELPLDKYFHPCEVMLGEASHENNGKIKDEECFLTAGSYVANITGTGETVCDACEIAYSNLEKINVPGGMLYRTDIGARLEKQLPKLQKFGYAKEWKYE